MMQQPTRSAVKAMLHPFPGLLTFCITLMTANLGFGSNCAPVPDGLISWWRAENDASDFVGTNNGQLLNGASFAPGEVGQAFSFNGVNQYVQVNDAPSLNPVNGLSLEGWLYVPAYPSDIVVIVAKRNVSLLQYQIALLNNQGKWCLRPEIDLPGGLVNVAGNTPIVTNAWYHWAMTYDGTNLNLYVNGNFDNGISAPGGIVPSTQPLVIGGVGANWPLNGRVDEVSLYNRAVSAAEIQAIYLAGSAGKCATASPPVVYSQPADEVVTVGQTAEFMVGAGGTVPLNYQWQFNGSALGGQTNSYLILTNVQLTNTGVYWVEITNSAGSIFSSNATLTVNLPPPCTIAPSGLISWWRGELNADDTVTGNNGTLMNQAGFAQGEVGHAFSFNGINQFVQVNDAPSLNPVNGLTLEGWLYIPAYPNLGVVVVAAKRGVSVLQYQIALLNNGGKWCLRPEIDLPSGLVSFPGNTTIMANEWYHWAMTYDGASLSLYVNGTFDSSIAAPGGIVASTQPLVIGGVGANWPLNGLVDEVSLYDRALSPSDIKSIYNAGAGGKCVVPIAPSLSSQPLNQTATIGSSVVFEVTASGSVPLSYQWQYMGNDILGATNTSLTLTNVQFGHQGSYSVVVTNVAGSVTSSNAVLTVVFPPATIQVGSVSNVLSGGSVTVPILLSANGNENALGFSLNFPAALLSFSDISLGSGTSGASWVTNTSLIGSGKLGVAIALPAGQTLAAGTQEVVDVTFSVGVLTNASVATIGFGDQPIARGLADLSGNPLAVNYVNGMVLIPAAPLEGDVWPRPNGDEALTISDWVQEGRYAAGLDSPTNGSEFQRADCAPRSTLGDGQITVIDWVQVGRYLAGLDPLTAAGGPTNPISNPGPLALQPGAPHKLGGSTRELLVTGGMLFPGQAGVASVQLVAQGDENALGFSLDYDPTLVGLAGVGAGANATGATIEVNANQSALGKVGVVLALPTGVSFAVGTQELVRVNFWAVSTNAANSPLSFSDLPVVRQVSNAGATALAASYVGASVSVNPLPVLSITQAGQKVSLSWPGWATNYVLQSSGSVGASAVWSNAPVSVTLTNGIGVVPVPVSGQAQFYRLVHK